MARIAQKRNIQRPGDLPVCLAGDSKQGLFQRQPLSKWLAVGLKVPVYEFGDLQVIPAPPSQHWLPNMIAWIASIALLAAFFWLQVGIYNSTAGPQATILLCLSILVEVYGLWKINEWIG